MEIIIKTITIEELLEYNRDIYKRYQYENGSHLWYKKGENDFMWIYSQAIKDELESAYQNIFNQNDN